MVAKRRLRTSSYPFPYPGLDTDKRQIRLIQFLHTRRSDAIEIIFRTISLDDKPRFALIGYTWGQPDLSETVLCHGYSFAVTPKVARILGSLREDDTYNIALYWIDSICINQADTSERIEQIKLMETICLQAELTIGWTDVELSQNTANFLAQVAAIAPAPQYRQPMNDIIGLFQNGTTIDAENLSQYESDYQAVVSRLSTTSTTASGRNRRNLLSLFRRASSSATLMGPSFTEHEAFVEFCRLLDAQYFGRMWVLADFVLSPRITLRCGPVDLAWDVFCDALEAMVMYGVHAELQSPQVENIIVANLLRQRYHHSQLSFTESILAVQGCNFMATDPRDHVYALYALSNRREDHLSQPDYSKSLKQIYISATSSMNEYMRTPIFLALAGVPKDDSRSDSLEHSSWVPYFAIPTQRLVLAHPNSRFSASSGRSELATDQYDMLGCRGYLVDTVVVIKSYLAPRRICDQYNLTGDNLFEFVNWYQFACSTESAAVPHGSDALAARFTETIQARGCNHVWESTEPITSLETASQVRAFLKYLGDPDVPETNAIRTFYAACLPSHDRRFGLTAKSRFCLLPFDAALGDVVCIIRGLKVPLLLRKSGSFYKNVGECYVHGIMHGEIDGTDEDIVLL